MKLWAGSECAETIAEFRMAYLHTTLSIPAIERYGTDINFCMLLFRSEFSIYHITLIFCILKVKINSLHGGRKPIYMFKSIYRLKESFSPQLAPSKADFGHYTTQSEKH